MLLQGEIPSIHVQDPAHVVAIYLDGKFSKTARNISLASLLTFSAANPLHTIILLKWANLVLAYKFEIFGTVC